MTIDLRIPTMPRRRGVNPKLVQEGWAIMPNLGPYNSDVNPRLSVFRQFARPNLLDYGGHLT